ncbi:MAG TPA: hypothetical protein VFB36_13765 [Nevskiaceae bacterium]|nr:hypothetical protein [Nevskiaceae bacterium]
MSHSAQSNILGATGVSQQALANYFRSTGLFGRDSNLTAAEQSVVCGHLPPIEGLRMPRMISPQTPRLLAVAQLSASLVAGADRHETAAQARRAGVPEHVVSEIVGVIDNVRVVFGAFAEPVRAESPSAKPELLRAA